MADQGEDHGRHDVIPVLHELRATRMKITADASTSPHPKHPHVPGFSDFGTC